MRTYLVVGAAPVCIDGRDVKPGETVTATLAPEHEAFYFEVGALAIVDEPAPTEATEAPASVEPAAVVVSPRRTT